MIKLIPTRQVLEQIKECVAFRDNFSEEFRRVNEIDLDEFIYDEIFKCADKIIKMMVKKAYEEGYKRLNIADVSIRTYRKLYRKYSMN